jgi:hypothetical protein
MSEFDIFRRRGRHIKDATPRPFLGNNSVLQTPNCYSLALNVNLVTATFVVCVSNDKFDTATMSTEPSSFISSFGLFDLPVANIEAILHEEVWGASHEVMGC